MLLYSIAIIVTQQLKYSSYWCGLLSLGCNTHGCPVGGGLESDNTKKVSPRRPDNAV